MRYIKIDMFIERNEAMLLELRAIIILFEKTSVIVNGGGTHSICRAETIKYDLHFIFYIFFIRMGRLTLCVHYGDK